MRIRGLLLIATVLAAHPASADQRPLATPHAHLDASDKCTACHVVFSGVPEEKCLGCHRDIDRRVQRGKGYHGRVAAQKRCIECHREHMGRGHELTPLETDPFPHQQTGYPLTGGHVGLDCRRCHTAKRPGTGRDSYLGAATTCVGCHGAYHGRAVGRVRLENCSSCHNTFEWKMLNSNMRFDHEQETRYPRTGRHKQVSCAGCHREQKTFGPIEVTGCVTCHTDPHPPGIFGRRICEECHLTSDFKQTSVFEHVTTGWPLRGKHQKLTCLKCHQWRQWSSENRDCDACHKAVHGSQFKGKRCSRCHRDTSWSDLSFNHTTMSQFALVGRHRRVPCAQCHPKGRYEPIAAECIDCHRHQDPHGEKFRGSPCGNCHSAVSWRDTRFDHSITGFALEGRHIDQACFRCHPKNVDKDPETKPDCRFCHTDSHGSQFKDDVCTLCHAGFDTWQVSFFDHTRSQFKLEGKHIDVDCDACHKNGKYRNIERDCYGCHPDFHEEQLSTQCESCHSAHSWNLVDFNHDLDSTYPLYGKHRQVPCVKCHVRNDYKANRGIPESCEGCHLDVHRGEKGDECDRCHTTADWSTNVGQAHNFGAFSLGGVHDRLPCERCHGPERRRVLAGTGPECVACHRDPHFGNLGPLCFECHGQEAFLPSTFLHIETGFRLSGAHRFVDCRRCHVNRVFGGTPSLCFFCHTDDFQATASGSCNHVGACQPDGCHNCHTTRAFVPARAGSNCGPCTANSR